MLFLSFFLACHVSAGFGESPTSFGQTPAGAAQSIAKSKLTYQVIAAESGGFGYDVYTDGRLLIHQPSIPGLPGKAGFDTREDAQKVAELVIRKLKNGEMPPTVTVEELRALMVLRRER